jgi:superfamily II DNA or RNA helicase
MIKFVKLNETYIKIVCDKSALEEISEQFKFVQKNYQYTPQGKKGWDGVIKMINTKNGNFLSGLLKVVILKFKELGYHQFTFEGFENSTSEYTENGILEALDEFKLPDDRQLREYQLNAILTCLLGQRRICIAATNAGKSLILYAISRILIESDKKVLIVVPTVLLVSQIYADFEAYAKNDEFEIEPNYHTITAGYAKTSPKSCYISTRDSISAIPKENLSEYLEKFDAILVDEVHGADAKTMATIVEKTINAKYKMGFTGTLHDSKIHELKLLGLFGTIKKIVSTKELIDSGYAAKLKIKCIILQYSDEMRYLVSGMEYSDELDIIIGSDSRNNFITNLSDKLGGNNLILIRFVEKHAKILQENFDKKNNKKTYLLTGDTDKDEKLFVKEHLETVTNCNLMGSYGLLSTGVSITNLNNLIFASPAKSKVRVLQSIGRMLRKNKNKTNAVVYDLVDDMTHDGRYNHMMRHFKERLEHYKNEGFDIEIIKVNIK